MDSVCIGLTSSDRVTFAANSIGRGPARKEAAWVDSSPESSELSGDVREVASLHCGVQRERAGR